MHFVEIHNTTRPLTNPLRLAVCDSFWTRFKGLMFRRELTANEGILIDETHDSVINSSIHMFFMNFDIAAVWVNSQHVVTHVTIAKKGRPYYASDLPARYIIEIHPSRSRDFQKGDQLAFIDA